MGFMNDCRSQTWDSVVGAETVVAKVEAFNKRSMEKFFPYMTVKRQTSDPPWMNDNIRRLQKKLLRIYNKHGRSRRWRRLKKLCYDLYRKRTENYVLKQKALLTGPNAAKTFYKHVKAYSSKENLPFFTHVTFSRVRARGMLQRSWPNITTKRGLNSMVSSRIKFQKHDPNPCQSLPLPT